MLIKKLEIESVEKVFLLLYRAFSLFIINCNSKLWKV